MPENMTHTTLSRHLKLLEDEGPIERTVYSEIPPKVEYSLSGIGHRFERALQSLEIWGNEYIDYLHEARGAESENH